MTEIDNKVTLGEVTPDAVTLQAESVDDHDSLLRRAAHARRDAALRLTGGASLDDGQEFAMRRMADALGASRVFFATWSQTGYVGRSLVGASDEERRTFVRRALPTLPPESTAAREIVQVSTLAGIRSTHPWLADLARADEIVLAVGSWAGQHPTCVIGLAGLDRLDDDTCLVIEEFLLMAMGATIAETLIRQRDRADLRRGEALDTLVDELDGDRRRISHEIHDGVLQSVSSIAHFLETLSASSESDSTRQVLERLRLEAQNSAIRLRQIVNDFEPEQRAEESMTAQVRSLTARVTDLFGLKIALDIGPGVDDVALTRPVLRVLRQALDNIITHADASAVSVTMTVDDGDELQLTIDDDGRGAEDERPWDLGVGLRSMTRVANEHGGELTTGPVPEQPGTRLVATFVSDRKMQQRATGVDDSGPRARGIGDHDLVVAVHQTTLSMLDQGRRPTLSSVAGSIGLRRRDLLARFMSADSMIADAVASLVDSIEERWAAFGPPDHDAPLEQRLDTLLEQRFAMEVWGRPIRQHTADVDPSSRFDDEVLTAFRPELSLMQPAERDDTGRLVAWLLRTRTIRAILGDASVDPDVARDTIRSVAATLLRGEHRLG